MRYDTPVTIARNLARSQTIRSRAKFRFRPCPTYFLKLNEQNRLMRTLVRLRWENPVEKDFPDKSASVTSRGIGYSGKYSRKSWFIAQLLEKAPRIGLDRQRQPPRWFSLSRPREEGNERTGVATISIKGRKALNDERRPVPFLKFALADTNELHRRDRFCLRDRETLFL